MAASIGIDCEQGHWKICCVEQGQVGELHQFERVGDMLEGMRQLCVQYPEPAIVIALDVTTPFVALADVSGEQLERLVQQSHSASVSGEIGAAVRELSILSSRSYCAPSVEYVPTVPQHRWLLRPVLGSARHTCAIVALLHYMREQEAAWVEMNFCYLNAGENGSCVLVVSDGQIVNGIDPLPGSTLAFSYGYRAASEGSVEVGEAERAKRATLDEAYREGLMQELAGLLALHHSEDIVVLGKRSGDIIEYLADTRQVYLFPHAHTGREGYEVALGAALLGEGLEQEGNAEAVVTRLQLRQAVREILLPGW